MAEKEIFRQAALERLSSPERLDQLIQVTHPRGWIALLALIVLLVAAILWGFFSSISTTVTGQGIIIKAGDVNSILSTVSGQVRYVKVKTGDVIEQYQTIAMIFRWDTDAVAINQIYYVVSPYAGRVLEVRVVQGQVIERGASIVTLETLQRPLEAVIYASPTEGKKVQAGMDVQVAPSTIKPEEFGYILGRVKSVSTFPASRDAMQRVLGGKDLAERFSREGPPYEIWAELIRDPDTPTGFKWSSKGADIVLESGTVCTAKVVVRKQSPISFVIPVMKERLGLYTGPKNEQK